LSGDHRDALSQTLAQNQKNAKSFYPRTLARDEKVAMMKQALSIEIGGFRSYEVFNEFYALDLIVFGMTNNISEAVRLGEHMLGEMNATMNFDMAKAVKQWKITNNAKYMDAMQRTGPINTLSVYMDNRKNDADNWGTNSIVNMDDPYWQAYYRKNYRS